MTQTVAADLQQLAKDHLWMHFTRMSGYRDSEIPMIVRGDGCYLEDANGKRYLDALAGLFSVNIGYGFGEEIGQAALEQMRELPFYTNWTYAHPRAIELATEVASLAPGDLNRAFFVSGGSEAVESAWKLARQYYLARGREAAAHVRRLDARARPRCDRREPGDAAPPLQGDHALDGVPRDDARRALADRDPRDPDAVRAARSPRCGTSATRTATGGPTARPRRSSPPTCSPSSSGRSSRWGPRPCASCTWSRCRTRAAPSRAPVGVLEGRAGALRPLRHPPLGRRGDHRRSGGSAPGSRRSATTSGPTSSRRRRASRPRTRAIGAVIATDRVAEPFLEGPSMYTHGITFGGHPVQCAVALKNIEIMKRERIVEHVRETEDVFRAKLETLLDLDIVGDVRGAGFFYALELVKDSETKADVRRRRVRGAAPRLPLACVLRGRPHLPRRRPRRPRRADLAAARRGRGGDGRDRRHPRRRARRGRSGAADRLATAVQPSPNRFRGHPSTRE